MARTGRRRGAVAAPTSATAPRHLQIRASIAALGLVAATFLAYWPAVHGGLLWDDAGHVTNPSLQSLTGLWRIWFELGATQQYYPLLHSAFWLEHRLWGDTVTGYHLVNISMHAASALLVVAIVKQLRLPGAWLAAVVFALHPVHVESVAWITEQKNTLSTVLYLCAALVYLQFDRTRRGSVYAVASLLFLGALLSKTTMATLPAALLVILWWRRGQLSWGNIGPLVPWLTLGGIGGVFTAWVERVYIGARGDEFALSLLERGLLAGRIPWFYLGKLIWPSGLTFNYPRWAIDASVWWQYLFPVALATVLAACWSLRRRTRGPLAAVLFFTGTLFPVLGFLDVYPFVFSYVADHFQYVASLGVIVPLASAVTRGVTRLPPPYRTLAPALVGVLVLALGATTRHQSATYRDAETLYRETIARNPGSWMAHQNLGIELIGRQDGLAEAIAEFQATVRLRPDSARAHRNLAMALSKVRGRTGDAIAEYEAALRLEPDNANDHLNLGGLLLEVPTRRQEGVAHLQIALRLNPDSATVRYMMGNALARIGQAGAEDEYRTAIRLAPGFAEAHLNLGNLLAARGSTEAAIAEYDAALRIRPDYAEAHYNLANALMESPNHIPDAIAHFEQALRIRPHYPEAHNNLALVLLGVPGRRADAIRHLESALRIDPNFAPSRELLNHLRTKGQ